MLKFFSFVLLKIHRYFLDWAVTGNRSEREGRPRLILICRRIDSTFALRFDMLKAEQMILSKVDSIA
jgi:hypothetical protein